MNKRSGKFYRRNEKEVMEELGFKPVPGSGSGWIHKEDGENETYLCQLKSTDADSYRIDRLDLDKLEYHASVAHKIPVFVIQFLQDGKIYVLTELSNTLLSPSISKSQSSMNNLSGCSETFEIQREKKALIKSSDSARNKFYLERKKQWKHKK